MPRHRVETADAGRIHATADAAVPPPPVQRETQVDPAIARSPHIALGIPTDADPSDDVLLDKEAYVVSYNPKRRDPNWVAWQLDASYLGHVLRKDNFRTDRLLPAGYYRVTPGDYLRSGYDRAHLCPSADRSSAPEQNALTFLMTNMHPQLHELNAGPWEQLEQYERTLARRPGAELYIAAGGIFDDHPHTIGNGVAVPLASYKVIVVLHTGQSFADVTQGTNVIATVMPNVGGVGQHEWTDFVVSVDDVETTTGYDFLNRVAPEVQAVIEARKATVP